MNILKNIINVEEVAKVKIEVVGRRYGGMEGES